MPRIGRGHSSIFSYLSKRVRIFRAIGYVFSSHDEVYGHSVHADMSLPPASKDLRQQFLGGFQPLVDMGRDFVKTFKPYKSDNHVLEDLAQPFRGVGNFLKGITTLVLVPLVFLIRLFPALYRGKNIKNSVEALSWLVSGVSNVVRGLTQIVATPLLLLKVALRLVLTEKKGRPKLEDSKGIKRLVNRLFELSDVPDEYDMPTEKQRADERKSDEIDYWIGYKCVKANMQMRELPEGLDVEYKAREGNSRDSSGWPRRRYISFKGFFQVREIVSRLPYQCRHLFDVDRYNAKPLDERIKIMKRLKPVLNKVAGVDAVLKECGIYRGNYYALLTMWAYKQPDSTLRVLPRDVAKMIADRARWRPL